MTNFYETVITVLRSDERFIAEDGTFLRNAVYEAAMKMDAQLIRLLLANDESTMRQMIIQDSLGDWQTPLRREQLPNDPIPILR